MSREPMNYLGWVERVLQLVAAEREEDGQLYGIDSALLELGLSEDRNAREGIWSAVHDLEALGLVENADGSGLWLAPTQEALKVREGVRLHTLWPTLAQIYVTDRQLTLLAQLIEMSEHREDGYAWVEYVQASAAFEALGWTTNKIMPFYTLTEQLEKLGLAHRMGVSTGGIVPVRPTYSGIVRVTQKPQSEWQAVLPGLIETWETTSVEFKRELSVSSEPQKAEFVRDIIALATTQASGRRLYIVGFDPKTHEYSQSFNPKIDSDQLENICHEYIKPALEVRLFRVAWREGEIGVIEPIREPRRVPYRVRRSVGPLTDGQTFVRHGTHVTTPDTEELASLVAEAERA